MTFNMLAFFQKVGRVAKSLTDRWFEQPHGNAPKPSCKRILQPIRKSHGDLA
ncbi:hypothetical protein OAE40_01510 [Rubripirellula sp.]|nr:hypothetical protein [Rubripirellula sp.]